jgi:hypothetical protein
MAIDQADIQTNMSAFGRFLVTTKDADIASFKTPDLRNVLTQHITFTTARKRRCVTVYNVKAPPPSPEWSS